MSENHPDSRMNDRCLRFWLQLKKWKISPPCAQWDYWHILRGDNGGILPLDVDSLMEDYLADPLSNDEIAIKHKNL